MKLVNDPRLHGALTIAWCLLLPVAHLTGWVESTTFVSDLSLIALILSSGAWWQAAKVAQGQADDADVQDVLDAIDR